MTRSSVSGSGPSKLYASSLNQALARALDADVVLADTWPSDADVDGVAEQLAIAASGYVSGEQARASKGWMGRNQMPR